MSGTESSGAHRAGDAAPRDGDRVSVREVLAIVVATWTLAIAAPLLNLLGQNSPFLVAHDLLGARLVLFAVAVVVALPLVLAGIVLAIGGLTRRGGRVAMMVVAAGLLTALLLPYASRWFSVPGPAVVVASLVGGGVLVRQLFARPLLHRFVHVLAAVAPLGTLALFLFGSPAAALLESQSANGMAASVRSPTPVFVLLFDELPLSALLDTQGNVDDALYPSFARLAATSTWFPGARTVSTNTEEAVPAILTGRPPKGDADLPVANEHPGGLFELLEGTDILALEPITRMCVATTCRTPDTQAVGGGTVSLGTTATDTTIVYLHQLLPPDLASVLPEIGANWVGFAGGGRPMPAGEGRPQELALDEKTHKSRVQDAVWNDSSVAADAFIDSIEDATPSSLYFGHFMLPHSPWTHLPNGDVYQTERASELGKSGAGKWGDNQWLVTHAQRRFLLQTQFTDRVLGRALEAIQERGVWEDALVIVLSDHGIAFEPGQRRRSSATPEAAADVLHVPLFVKAPGQTTAERSQFPALVTDVAPTIADVLGLTPRQDYAGASLLDINPETQAARETPEQATAAVRLAEAAARKYSIFDPGPDGAGLYAFGEHANLLHATASELAQNAAPLPSPEIEVEDLEGLETVDSDTGFVPALVTGTLTAVLAGDGPGTLALAIDGQIAGLARPFVDTEGVVRFQTLLDPGHLSGGEHDVEAFAVVGPENSPGLRPLTIRR